MAYQNDFSAVRGAGAQAKTRRTEYNLDLTTTSLDFILLSQLWIPGVNWFRNGYLYAEAQVSAAASANVIVTAWITIGNSRVVNAALGNSSVNRPSSCSLKGQSPPLFPTDGTQDVQLHIGVIPSPGPGSCTLNAVSFPERFNAWMYVTFIVDPTVVSA